MVGRGRIFTDIWVFPINGGFFPPNHPILKGFSIIFTIHFGVPLFLETSIYGHEYHECLFLNGEILVNVEKKQDHGCYGIGKLNEN